MAKKEKSPMSKMRPGKDADFGKYKHKPLKFGESLPAYEKRNAEYVKKQKKKK
jgi:hypothetical protein